METDVWIPFFAGVSAACVAAVSVLFVTFQLRLSKDADWAGPRKRSTMISGLTELWVPLALTLMA
ncbi:hypothetical protein DFR67_114154 [Williamsia limnetica]|uniref:Uncharacterized protein n=1 Tax=Williamsia limnetica TaxID=882452 RepID=A0A318RJU6_WILLI|nr:hypothetical protein DFR67_114154 [Williamsia limnetica]